MAHSEEYPDGTKLHKFIDGELSDVAKKLGELSRQAIERGAVIINQQIVCDNDRCPCGSGIRFDLCCKDKSETLETNP